MDAGSTFKTARTYNWGILDFKAYAKGSTSSAERCGRAISPEIEHFMEEDPPVQKLTQRQSDILASLVRGLTNDDIAKQFSIQRSSAKDHLTAIFEKLGAANRSEAVSIALRKHLLKT